MAASTIRLPKKRQTLDDLPLSRSEADLSSSFRRASPSVASLYASTLTPPGSRSISPAGRGPPSRMAAGVGASSPAVGGIFGRSLLDSPVASNPGDPLSLVLQAFVPHVAVYASKDTDALVREKGFERGLWELLRPFGEQVPGKVAIRDSVGSSKSWEDFSIRFVRFGENVEQPEPFPGALKSPPLNASIPNGPSATDLTNLNISSREAGRLGETENVVNRHLSFAEGTLFGLGLPGTPTKQELDIEATSPYYTLFLRRLLSGLPLSSHETFAHPVACVMAICSRNPSPIEALRMLYKETSEGKGKLPDWVSPDYLRYYVLVHEEENDDVAKSMALFEQMKRNFGLHCHLLRIRSSQSAETDDDSIPLPRSEWMTAAEELAEIHRSEEREEFEDPTRYIFDSDATAIRTFVREMVVQSIIPTMERNISIWNDQVASKRKGIGGRFMSMSRRWAGFGGGSKTSSSGSNYSLGFYRPDTPEATLRRMADYAFMLRDWKLATSTYSLLRADYENDHAWRHHAATNEMGALALLILGQTKAQSQAKILDSVNDMLRDGFYSYYTRFGSPYGALRCFALGMELLKLRGGPAIDSAVKLGMRLMETNPRLVGPVGEALFRERMAVYCASKQGVGSLGWGSWRRKSAFWSVLGAEAWLGQGKYVQAQRCLNDARVMYSMLQSDEGISGFDKASDFMAGLNQRLKEGLAAAAAERARSAVGGHLGSAGGHDGAGDQDESEEEVEVLAGEGSGAQSRRRARRSLMGGGAPDGVPALETAPSGPLSSVVDEGIVSSPKDDFG